ncbi:MAG: hypothetical protein ACFFB2_02655 [Promethearchaeota archaeon]
MVHKDRPLGVTILAIIYMVLGVIVIFTGIMILGGVAGLAAEIESILGPGASGFVGSLGFIILIAGLLVFLIGIGLWKLNIIAYIVVLISLGMNVLVIILSYADYLTLLLNGAIYALINPIITILIFVYLVKVRDSF